MRFNIPISSEKADRLIEIVGLSSKSCIYDAGCGNGEFLIRCIEATGASGIGIDLDPRAIAEARDSVEKRIPHASCELCVGDVYDLSLPENSIDFAVCLGSTHAYGAGDAAYPNTLGALSAAVCPGGQLLIGEGYWKQAPPIEYLETIGDPVGIYRDHAGNVWFGEDLGLVPHFAMTANEDEWDEFEWTHRLRIERESALQPKGGGVDEKLSCSRRWRDAYLKWGRDTMGFGFYLFMKPPET